MDYSKGIYGFDDPSLPEKSGKIVVVIVEEIQGRGDQEGNRLCNF